LQQLKGRSALIVQCDDFAINDGILNIKGGDRVFYLRELAAQILFVSGEYPGLIATA
jgi:hypothetical protein